MLLPGIRFFGSVSMTGLLPMTYACQISSKSQQAGPAPDRVGPVLLEVVAEKTGYPVDMLELNMSLDADLGIDSIKRVEILSALQEQLPGVPSV